MVVELGFLVVGMVVGAVAGWLASRAFAPGVDAAPVVELAHAQAEVAGLEGQLALVREQYKDMTDHYRKADAERAVGSEAESKVLQQMAPIAAALRAMQTKVDEIEKQRSHQHGELAEQIRMTRQTAETSKAAAQALASALKNNQVRGAYGEIQLESIVEAAGMLKRVDFVTQQSIEADSGARRPDMVVKLPGGRELAVDAKVPAAAFFAAQAPDVSDEQRASLLKAHASDVRTHVDALARKEYFTGLSNSPEATVAFIASDAILDAATAADPGLFDHAMSKGVVLATPSGLFTLLKGLAYSWRQENLADEAREVVAMGQELFKRLRTNAEHAAKLGRTLTTAVKDYNAFAGSYERSLLVQARRFDSVDFEPLPEIEGDAREFTAVELALPERLGEVGDQID